MYDRGYARDEQKSIIFFTGPAEVRGTAFLARHFAQQCGTSVALGLRRYRRDVEIVVAQIAADGMAARGRSVALPPRDSSGYGRLRRASATRASIDGAVCHVIELIPQRDDIGYRRIVTWLGQDDLVARQLEFWGDGAALAKRINRATSVS